MHIVFVVTRGDSIGGAQIHVKDLSIRLLRDGHRATVLTGSSGDMTDLLDKAGVPWRIVRNLVRPIHPWKDFLAILETRKILKELEPDLVSTHTAKAGLVGRLGAHYAGFPSIFTVHGWQFAEGIPAFQRFVVESLERFTAKRCAKIVTVSKYDEAFALNRRVVRPEKMITIHNGMPEVPAARAVAEGIRPVRLIMVARFQEQKDHATLFAALAGLKDLSWDLELVGDGPDLGRFQQLALDLGLQDRILFSGQRLDVAERLASSDVFLLVSNWEGFPRSILEAMREGLPVIASDVGGCNESVIDGETGYLVAKADAEGLGKRLRELIEAQDLRLRLGEAGRKRFRENFTFDAMYRKTLDVYREAVREPFP